MSLSYFGTTGSETIPIEVEIIRDSLVEPDEDFFLDINLNGLSFGDSGASSRSVRISIEDFVNAEPEALADTVATDERRSITIDVLGNDADADGDALTLTTVPAVSALGASISVASGVITYDPGDILDPEPGEVLLDSFSYTISDGFGGEDTAVVEVAVAGVNGAPVALDDAASVSEDETTSGDVLGNDLDPDSDPLDVVQVDGDEAGVGTGVAGDYGTLTLLADGTWTYLADLADDLVKGDLVTDEFEYVVSDAFGELAVAKLSIEVSGADEILIGRGDDDRLKGGDGDDKLVGRGGDDKLIGRGGDDLLKGGGQADKLKGGGGKDTLKGQKGDDVLKGGGGNDKLIGAGGKDALQGQRGNDKLIGGGGKDEFVFKRGDGRDVVKDWQDGRDTIVIKKGASGFVELDIYQKGKHAFIDYGRNGDLIKLIETNVDDLDRGDFAFG